MRRALGLGLLLAALAAAPAGAAAPGPTVLDFEDQRVGAGVGIGGNPGEVYGGRTDVIVADSDACGVIASPGGNFGPRYVFDSCQPFELTFTSGQAMVAAFAMPRPTPTTAPSNILAVARDANGAVVTQAQRTVPEGTWAPIVLRSPDGSPSIRNMEIGTSRFRVNVDDIGFSPTAQPDVDITGGPAGAVGSGDAAFTFAGNQPGMTFSCKLDDRPAEGCGSPKSYSGLGVGQHTFTVTGRDRWGTDDPSPPVRTWTVVADRDGDSVLDGADNCPDAQNAAQGDADADRVGDACEVLPSGNTPVEAGKVATVKLISGEVFVRLPAGASGSAFTSGLRVPFQSSGFLPLKGVAAVPMGSTLDTRRGEVALTAAINGQPARSRRQLRREARFRAGIFAIRQARRARKAKRSKRIPPRAELASPPGAETPCQASGPAKGVAVRALSMTAKGVFRTVGGAATVAPAKGIARFITTDRCDGTVTEVFRGRAAVIAKRTGRRTVVRAGRAYIVRARLFQARKGRRP